MSQTVTLEEEWFKYVHEVMEGKHPVRPGYERTVNLYTDRPPEIIERKKEE